MAQQDPALPALPPADQLKHVRLNVGERSLELILRNDRIDLYLLKKIFEEKAHYNFSMLPVAAALARFHRQAHRPLILDCGAHIGLATVWLALTYPRSQVVALEPDPTNFALLRQNAATVGAEALQGAVQADGDAVVRLHDPGTGSWGYTTTQSAEPAAAGAAQPSGVTVPSYAMDDLLARYPEGEPFIAKIDIEGAEQDLFAANLDWIDRFPLIVMEPHDRKFPGQQIARPALQALSARARDFFVLGEDIVSVRADIAAAGR